jgi:hypothetical protein
MKRLLNFIGLIVYIVGMFICCYFAFRSVQYIDEYTKQTTKN